LLLQLGNCNNGGSVKVTAGDVKEEVHDGVNAVLAEDSRLFRADTLYVLDGHVLGAGRGLRTGIHDLLKIR
jgi:hypothetical protein